MDRAKSINNVMDSWSNQQQSLIMKPFNLSLKFEAKLIFLLLIPMVPAAIIDGAPGFINNIMLAHLGAEQLAAGALASFFFSGIMMLSYGVLCSVSTLVAHHHGAKNTVEIGQLMRDAGRLVLFLTIPVMFIVWNGDVLLVHLGQNPATIPLATQYLHGLSIAVLPDFLSILLWQFFIGLGRPRVTLMATLLYVPINLFANYCLMFGAFGLPRLEMLGLGLGNAIAFSIIFLFLVFYIYKHEEFRGYFKSKNLKKQHSHLKELLHLGIPMGLMWTVELIFGFLSAILMGKVNVVALAANQITMQTLMFAFVIIGCISQAVTVRMGYNLGAKNTQPLRAIAVAGVLIVVVYSLCMGVIYSVLPQWIIGLDFNLHDPKNQVMIGLAIQFLAALTLMQFFDGTRFVLFGVLRGLKDTRYAFWVSLLMFLGVAVPAAYITLFILHWPAVSLWYCATVAVAGAAFLLGRRCWILIKREEQK